MMLTLPQLPRKPLFGLGRVSRELAERTDEEGSNLMPAFLLGGIAAYQ
jgi:hypothetical protein